jgi:hypothetical protein
VISEQPGFEQAAVARHGCDLLERALCVFVAAHRDVDEASGCEHLDPRRADREALRELECGGDLRASDLDRAEVGLHQGHDRCRIRALALLTAVDRGPHTRLGRPLGVSPLAEQ